MGMGEQYRLYIARHKGKIPLAVFALGVLALAHTAINKDTAPVKGYHMTGAGHSLCRAAKSKFHICCLRIENYIDMDIVVCWNILYHIHSEFTHQ